MGDMLMTEVRTVLRQSGWKVARDALGLVPLGLIGFAVLHMPTFF